MGTSRGSVETLSKANLGSTWQDSLEHVETNMNHFQLLDSDLDYSNTHSMVLHLLGAAFFSAPIFIPAV